MNYDYKLLAAQVKALAEGETNLTGVLANVSALLMEALKPLWIGFYIVDDSTGREVSGQKLILGPFQGPVACMKIDYGKGVCGHAWEKGETVIVPDVEKFDGHIACSSLSRSEIVVPIKAAGRVVGVLDADSREIDTFTSADAAGLEEICSVLAACFENAAL